MRTNMLSAKIPLFLNVKSILLKEIDAGILGEVGRLPSEEVLAKRYEVSRATIRSTLQSLEKDGIVTRQHGIGTFINSESLQLKMHIDEAKGFFQLIIDSGHKPSIYKTTVSETEADSRIAKLLNLAPKQKILLLERLFLGDGEPAIFVAEYIPIDSLLRIPLVEELPESIYQFADSFCQETIDYSISEIIPVKATEALKQKMMLKQSEIFLKMEELHFGKQSRPVIFSDVYVRDSIIRFQVVRKRPVFNE